MSKAYTYDLTDDEDDGSRRNRPQVERPQGNTYKRPDKPAAQRKNTSVSFNGLHRRRNKRMTW